VINLSFGIARVVAEVLSEALVTIAREAMRDEASVTQGTRGEGRFDGIGLSLHKEFSLSQRGRNVAGVTSITSH
jgi:hypothetical protein